MRRLFIGGSTHGSIKDVEPMAQYYRVTVTTPLSSKATIFSTVSPTLPIETETYIPVKLREFTLMVLQGLPDHEIGRLFREWQCNRPIF